jgi:GNAT superfamily N-acetyltransferase
LGKFVTSYEPSEEGFAATFPELVGKLDCVFQCIEVAGVVEGYVLAFAIPTLFANGPVLEIIELFVDEPRRGDGLGKALVEAAVGAAWNFGCVEVVVPTRRSAGFYEMLGFARTAEYLKLRR